MCISIICREAGALEMKEKKGKKKKVRIRVNFL